MTCYYMLLMWIDFNGKNIIYEFCFTTCNTETGYNHDYWCSFFYFSMRELDGLNVWDGFGLLSFTFKTAVCKPSVLREVLKSVLFFLDLTQSVYAKICIGMQQGSDFKFQNTFDRLCNKIRLEIQSRKFLRKSNLNQIKGLHARF